MTTKLNCLLAITAGILVLGGCVTSQFPLLDEKNAVVEQALAGRYTLTIDNTPHTFEVYIHDKKYVLTENGKLAFIGTVQPRGADLYLAQLRGSIQTEQKSPSPYTYILIRKSTTGAELNLLPCSSFCEVKDFDSLSKLAYDAELNFTAAQFVTATKESGDSR